MSYSTFKNNRMLTGVRRHPQKPANFSAKNSVAGALVIQSQRDLRLQQEKGRTKFGQEKASQKDQALEANLTPTASRGESRTISNEGSRAPTPS